MILKKPGYGPKSGDAATSSSLSGPMLIVLLSIMLGATLYLHFNRYIRPSTAYALIALEAVAIVAIGYLMYQGAM